MSDWKSYYRIDSEQEARKVADEIESIRAKVAELKHERKEMFGGTKRDLADKLARQVSKNNRLQAKVAELEADKSKLLALVEARQGQLAEYEKERK
jgi:septal ring factor EnvC (AmiA/AmiB activator)